MLRTITVCLLALLWSGPNSADEQSGTLKRIAESGRMNIGFVPDAPPMSFVNDQGQAAGYSIELCRRIARSVRQELGLEELSLTYIPLQAPSARINAVAEGKVDIECGASTVTMSRREKVDFTLMTFITGGSVLSREDAPIITTANINKKTIAVIDGTTTESALRNFIDANEFDVRIELIQSHDEGIEVVKDKRVDGYASDRAMLVGQTLRAPGSKFVISRDVFSFEPYGLMVARGDTDFRLVADRALAKLFGSAAILRLYYDWFGQYGQPLDPVVKAMFEFQAVGE